MSISPTSTNSRSFSLPTSPQQQQSMPDLNSPAPPYSPMPSKDELSFSNQPSAALPPYTVSSDPSAAPIPSGIGDPGSPPAPPKAGMGMGGLILAGVAGIPGYFAGKNILKSHPVVGGIVGSLVTALASIVGLAYLSQKSLGK